MTHDQHMFVNRLAVLRDLIKSVPVTDYDHTMYINPEAKNECGTAACALGHAVINKEKLFPTLNIDAVYEGNRLADIRATSPPSDFCEDAADEYFGPGSYEAIMSACAYYNDDIYAVDVKTTDVVARIEKFVFDTYGVSI